MARKIGYADKAMAKVLKYLKEHEVEHVKSSETLLVKATELTHDKVFRDIAHILTSTRYGLQENIKSLEIEIFNSSI